MKITINGKSHNADAQLSVTELLTELEHDLAGVAIAVNQNIIPQTEWLTTLLEEGDEVALFRAIAGG